MLHRTITTTTPVKTSMIVSALILLLGVLIMAYGFFNNNSQVTYIGIFITGLTSWAILSITLTKQISRRLTSRSSHAERDGEKRSLTEPALDDFARAK